MTKVRTLSRYFLKGHPREGEKTDFAEKFLSSLNIDFSSKKYFHKLIELNADKLALGTLTETVITNFWLSLEPTPFQKLHTIRGKHHFKVGDLISICCWSGKPYATAQIRIAPDIEVKKTFDFHIRKHDYFINHSPVNYNQLKVVAANDGLAIDDFECWFNVKKGEVFAGQIICWNSTINY
jgi:hypothetical protein